MLAKEKKGTLISYEEMIDHLKDKGIVFNITNEAEAKRLLIEKNYYYKLTAYKKNYYKNVLTGKYDSLEFAYLVDLASIDMRIRYYVLELSLDVEHSIKTTLLDLITKNPLEDAFSLVNEFKIKYPDDFATVESQLGKSRYLKEMYLKRNKNIPIWVLIELMSFGNLTKLVRLYYDKYPNPRLKKANDLLIYSRHPRNSCAHSNIMLINIYGNKNKISSNISSSARSVSKEMNINSHDFSHMKIHDLACLFKLHQVYCGDQQNTITQEKGQKILERFNRNHLYYQKSTHIKKFKSNLSKMVDSLI